MSDKLGEEMVLLVGAGKMAVEYGAVLKDIGANFAVLGRGRSSASAFESAVGVSVTTGKLQDQLKHFELGTASAIVAVNAINLAEVTIELLKAGVKRLLVEKPVGLSPDEVEHVANVAAASNAEVHVAYNRRYFASVAAAKSLIDGDGGPVSVKFDFTEANKRIELLDKPPREFETWFFGNSSHVVDLAFYLGGEPLQLSASIKGGTSWHPDGAIFAGHGRTDKGAVFSYHANWMAPGRWGVEVMTSERRIILQPIECLQQQTHEGFNTTTIKIDDELDNSFKPGIWRQVDEFLSSNSGDTLSNIHEHARHMQLFESILKGRSFD